MAPASSQRPSRARINVCRLNAEKVVNPPHRRSVLDVASEGDMAVRNAVGLAAKHEPGTAALLDKEHVARCPSAGIM